MEKTALKNGLLQMLGKQAQAAPEAPAEPSGIQALLAKLFGGGDAAAPAAAPAPEGNPFWARAIDNVQDEGVDLKSMIGSLFNKAPEAPPADVKESYDKGFIDKCAAYGVDPQELIR